jgi:hypothetical protein
MSMLDQRGGHAVDAGAEARDQNLRLKAQCGQPSGVPIESEPAFLRAR